MGKGQKSNVQKNHQNSSGDSLCKVSVIYVLKITFPFSSPFPQTHQPPS
jgi:hypothetical protein